MVLYGWVSLMKSEKPPLSIYKKINGTSSAKTLPQINSATRLSCKIIIVLLYHASAKTVAQE